MDNQIIKINTDTEGKQTVDARELHEFLEIGTRFDVWIERRIKEYGFIINSDFCTFMIESSGGRPSTDYHISIDMAKELSMVERNDKGKQARQYFIQMEKVAKNLIQQLTPEEQLLSQVKMLAQSIELSIETKRKQQELELAQKALITSHVEHDVRLDRLEARIQDDPAYFAVTGYANIHKFKITDKDAQYIGKLATKISNEWCVRIGKVRHNRWGLVNSYHESVLDYVFNSEMELVA
jgi:phage anti-repressor protein